MRCLECKNFTLKSDLGDPFKATNDQMAKLGHGRCVNPMYPDPVGYYRGASHERICFSFEKLSGQDLQDRLDWQQRREEKFFQLGLQLKTM